MSGYIDGKIDIWYGDSPPSNQNILWQKRIINNNIESTILYEYNNNTSSWQIHNNDALNEFGAQLIDSLNFGDIITHDSSEFQTSLSEEQLLNIDSIEQISNDLNNHKLNIQNPHSVNKEQVGLGNVSNISPEDLPLSTYQKDYVDTQDSIETQNRIESDELLQLNINSALSGLEGFLEYNTEAPTPERTCYYEFISSGTSLEWLGLIQINYGDRLYVNYVDEVYTYSYAPQNDKVLTTPQALSQTQKLNAIENIGAEKKIDYGYKIISNNIFDVSKTVEGFYIDNNTGSIVEYEQASCTDYIPVSPGTDYIRTNLNLVGLVFYYDSEKNNIGSGVNVDGSFTTPIDCYFIRINITLTSEFSQKNLLMVNEGVVLLPLDVYSDVIISINDKDIRNAVIDVYSKSEVDSIINNSISGNLIAKIVDNMVYLRSYWSETDDLIQTISMSLINPINNNNPVDFNGVYIIPKTTLNSDIEFTINNSNKIHDQAGDSASPSNYNGTYIGANHGPYFGIKVTLTSHDKTQSDIGSLWIDDDLANFYLIQIIDENNLIFLSENNGVGDLWSFLTNINGELIHSSGAVNTSSVVCNTQELYQIASVLQNQTKSIFIDGRRVSDNGIYICDSLEIRESYDISDLPGVLEYVKTNKVSVFNDNSIPKSSKQSVSYKFSQNGSCTIYQYFINYKELALNYLGFIQQYSLNSDNYKVFRLIPDSSSCTGDTKVWNFDNIEEITSGVDYIIINPENYKTPLKPPYRFIEYISNEITDNKIAGNSFGYSPVRGICNINSRNNSVSSAFFSTQSKKMYPIAVDAKLNVDGKIPINQIYECVCFKNYYNPSENQNATAVALYKENNYWILMIDYHKDVIFDKIKLPPYLIGMDIEVIEKTPNAHIHSSIIEDDGIYISIDTSESPIIGYLVLKIL